MFQTQFTELCTIIPEHFTVMPGLYKGTRALSLVEPVLAQKVGLFWAEGETVMPMTAAIVGIVQEFNKTGELRLRLGDTAAIETKPQRIKVHPPSGELLDVVRTTSKIARGSLPRPASTARDARRHTAPAAPLPPSSTRAIAAGFMASRRTRLAASTVSGRKGVTVPLVSRVTAN